ncbi:rhomboid family protein [Natrialba magadii ATCC 43099]|uniref:Rhomboid family protein n=1 Tax=Natrialba magadii (strain ATCC 43099 / DSM 3394 / CCM 3739 / CIP 104546 / IAM 13178 / JCM 8861 / NBRC 102185 / NCIMB 2190 / MS3) TaxID=547559 RepID=D3SUF4_NATMM|nr:rhomboid family intramembrane serine protease [Natrialba magadii]ADD05212.1 rhomboid family protein [Natrialba magadii ATCC 43099]ELY23248.1 rhomboid family protein [Natrialba magadii ATCC 43099]
MGHQTTPEPAPLAETETGGEKSEETWGEALGRNPVVQTLAIMMAVSILGWSATGGQGIPDDFAVAMPVFDPWWSLITATYGHLDTAHLISNATMVAVAGGLISLYSSAIRFHLFFLTTGVLSSISQVYIADAFGTSLAVIGASGSAFALGGYIIGSVSTAGDSEKSGSFGPVAVLVLLAAGGVTIWMSPPGTAFGSHFVGVLLGLIAGRLHLLRTR